MVSGLLRLDRPVGQAAVDLGAHGRTVSRRMVEPAIERGREQFAGALKFDDLLVEEVQPAAGDGLPLRGRGGVQDAVDVVESQSGVLQKADEDEPAQRLVPIPALTGLPGVGAQQAAPLVVPDRGRGHVRLLGELADGEEFGHGTSVDLKSGSSVKVRAMSEPPATSAAHDQVPNHHADHAGFTGLTGLLAAASMILGRQGDARLAERLSGLGPGDVVVDIGCGPGAAVRYAARRGASTIGVDPAPVMLRLARMLTRPALPARFVPGTAETLPLPDASASVAWTIASVHHWADLDAGLGEVLRVLKPRGRFVAIEQQTQPEAQGLASHGWTDVQADTFARRCLDHGFVDARVERHEYRRRKTVSVTATAPTAP